MNDGKRQVTDETEPDENPIATIYYENGTELTGKAVTLQDGTVGVRIPGEFFKTALLPDGSMPDGVKSVNIGPKHVEGGLPLTDDMVCMAVTAMLRDAVGLGIEVANKDYLAFAVAIDKLLCNDVLRQKYSDNARQRVLDMFTIPVIKPILKQLYRL